MSLNLCLRLLALLTFITLLALSDVSGESSLHKILKKRGVESDMKTTSVVDIHPNMAKQFLSSLRRTKRNLWDRSRPDVQQWIQQFMHMGFDEARLETDLAYWMDFMRSNDQGRQHHYDENSPTGPRYPSNDRHGANVNYDYY